MQGYTVNFLYRSGNGMDQVYLASSVEARIKELERLLNEARYFAQDDFPPDLSSFRMDGVVGVTSRYAEYWIALNAALGRDPKARTTDQPGAVHE